MINQSIWKSTEPDVLRFPPPDEDLDVDVVVIGGGITGISTGYFMARAGMRVAVLEAAYVGWGTTGNSTGNLYVPIDEMYRQVSEKFDVETARLLSESRARGLEAIDDIIREHGIDCDFVRTSWNLIAETTDALGDLEKERDAMKEIGIDAELRSGSEFLPNAV
ncbi:MAG TPA: FAD-dependent oxidoreductase, partial [Cryomorphaceae bacterium]|nr:FAD-dependent oxidoreductase [Cryomorphaceae bacterium]